MPPSTHHPHDKLFRTILSEEDEAEGFLRAYLPANISNELNWPTLKLMETSFVDDALRESESDLLFQIQHRESAEPVVLYLLFEHQSVPDKWMRLRLLRYRERIWNESFKWHPNQEWAPPILPVVFYQGESPWEYSTEFADLLPEPVRAWPYTPRMSHVLIDQSGIAPDEIKGNLKARIMQLLMLAAYHKPIRETLRLAAQILPQVPVGGGTNYVYLFVHYIAATQTRDTVREFVAEVQQQQPKIGGEMVTYAEELLQEGEAKGRAMGKIEGKIETIENLLKLQIPWATIQQATGIDPVQYVELKQQMADAQATDSPQEDGTEAD